MPTTALWPTATPGTPWSLLGAGSAAAAVGGPPGLGGVQLLMLPPDLVADDSSARIETEVLECKLRRLPLGQHQLTIRARLDAAVCTRSYTGSTALTQRWRGWALVLYVRGTKVFDGLITGWSLSGEGGFQPGQTHAYPGWEVTLTAETWLAAGAGARQIETSTGGNWTKSDTPNRILAYLIREQMISGTIITPSGWQGSSEVRTDFGGITYACALPTAAGTSIDYSVEPGTLVLDAILELCNSVGSDSADWLWPTESRSGTTVTIGVLRGRSGGSREIGADRTTVASGKVGGGPFSFWRGNLIGVQEEGYERNRANKVKVMGKGRGAGQQRAWVENQTDIAAGWIREETVVAPGAGTTAELEREGYRVLNKRSGAIAAIRYKLIEIPGAVWPDDFDVGDTVPVALPWGETRSEDIRGIEWGWTAPRPPEIAIDAGVWPDIPEREIGRSGGGGGGGRGGGGRGRSKSGDSDTDPDDIVAFKTITAQTGGPAVADVVDDALAIEGYDTGDYLRAYTHAADDPESVKIELHATVTACSDFTANRYIRVKDAAGGSVYIPASTSAPAP